MPRLPATGAHKVHLLLMTYFHRKVLEMLEIHKTLTESCSPLAKTILKMVALKNVTMDPLLQSKLPPQLLLATVHHCAGVTVPTCHLTVKQPNLCSPD